MGQHRLLIDATPDCFLNQPQVLFVFRRALGREGSVLTMPIFQPAPSGGILPAGIRQKLIIGYSRFQRAAQLGAAQEQPCHTSLFLVRHPSVRAMVCQQQLRSTTKLVQLRPL